MSNIVSLAQKSSESIILKMIATIGTNAKNLSEQVQRCATCIVLHAVDHGDVTSADRLVAALEYGNRRDSLVQWFVINGCMRIVETVSDKGAKVKSFALDRDKRDALKKRIEKETRATVAGSLMRGEQWFTSKKEADPMQAMDLTKALRALLAKAKKAQANPEVAAKSDLSLLSQLESMVPKASKLYQ